MIFMLIPSINKVLLFYPIAFHATVTSSHYSTYHIPFSFYLSIFVCLILYTLTFISFSYLSFLLAFSFFTLNHRRSSFLLLLNVIIISYWYSFSCIKILISVSPLPYILCIVWKFIYLFIYLFMYLFS